MKKSETSVPLNRPMLLSLIILDKGAVDMGGIVTKINEMTDGDYEYSVSEEAVYKWISRLRRVGLIEEAPIPSDAPQDYRYRYHRITTRGQRALTAELQRMEKLIRLAWS